MRAIIQPCRPRLWPWQLGWNATRAAGSLAYDAAVLQLILNGIGHIGMPRGATSDAGRSVRIRAQAQERSVRRRVDPDTFGHVFQVAPSIPRRARKQSVVPRQGIMLAVFRVVPKINIKFLSEFGVQTAGYFGDQRLSPIRSYPDYNLVW